MSRQTISDFVMDHCTTCAAGWTRNGSKGEQVIYCLLDREPVWPDMAACDRYELKEGLEIPDMSLPASFAATAAECLRRVQKPTL